MKSVVLVTLAVGSLCHKIPLVAQDFPSPAKPHACFGGRPLPHCDSFWITEFGFAPRLTRVASGNGPLYAWELGGMKNLDTKSAFGAAVFAEATDEGGGWGIRPRYRRWFNPTTALDLAPGMVIQPGNHPGFSGQVALNFSNYFALTSTVRVTQRRDYVPTSFKPITTTQTAWFGGARLGGLPGTVVGLAVPTLVFFAFLIACGNGTCFD